MIPILYDPNETVFASNGVCRLRDCISCKVTEERNGIYEVEFEYPVDGANFDEITLGRIVCVEHDDSNDIQPFDLVSYSKPIDGIVTFRGVHISYRLNRCVIYGKNKTTLASAVSAINNVLTNTGFIMETDKSGTARVGAFNGVPVAVRQLLGGMEGSLLDTFGGEYLFDKFRIKLLKARGEKKDFAIRYGINMTNYTEDLDYSDTFSACYPYWVDNNVAGAVVVGGRTSSGMSTFNGFNGAVPLDLSEKFESKPTKAQLQSAALSYMTSNQTYLPEKNIQVDFIRLQDTEEYKEYASLLECKLCDSIEVIFPRYGVSGYFKIVKTVYDVLAERYESMELGNLSTTLAEALGVSEGGTKTGADIIYYDNNKVNINSDLAVGGSITSDGKAVPVLAQGGVITVNSVGANSYVNQEVTFDSAYSSAPIVVAGLAGTITAAAMGSVSVSAYGVSTTGFTARIYNNTSTARNITFRYIAIQG